MINQANTAFVLISTILVFFMTPGLEGNYLSLKKEDNHNKKQQVRLAAFFMKKDYKLSCFLAFLICSFT
ncbi:hypothetical protein [Ligilactobacillus salivarius]|uniref:hypothetical protein n=1 Tax=Ligilactobacillus salivarius TaxID=1624 RepID=UPI001F442B14|nr:hypothetical protein [Ligilactobacillus salivarius]